MGVNCKYQISREPQASPSCEQREPVHVSNANPSCEPQANLIARCAHEKSLLHKREWLAALT